MVIKKTSHARWELWYHIAWSTKYRKRIFDNEGTKEAIKEIFREIALQYEMEITEIQILSDHVHFLISAPPKIAPFQIVQILKSVSTKKLFDRYEWLNRYYWGGEIWAGGYFVRSIGVGLTKVMIEKYIKEQSEEIG
ncbi:MAG TPA: IS200/IS605 family transposase [Elusimicrobia bacterium]|jgi:putative transposase|nr:IS200/IS605 family transposase [Elusimicrobiota bacterium]